MCHDFGLEDGRYTDKGKYTDTTLFSTDRVVICYHQ